MARLEVMARASLAATLQLTLAQPAKPAVHNQKPALLTVHPGRLKI
jgi:hypothetical protein